MDSPATNIVVNGVTADFATETLLTTSGQSVSLRPQTFAVLRYLAEHANRLVTKNELMEALWPGLVVTDDNLVQCVHEIRHVFNDYKRAVFKTAPKRGYRLVLPTGAALGRPVDAPERLLDGRDPTERIKVSIAVLPFVNLSSDREQEYFSDAITEDIITDLSRWQSLAVVSRNSSFRFRGQHVDGPEAGRKLGVLFVVEGSVRRLGERIRITAQLTDSQTGNHVWAERYDRPMPDLFALQDEVVRTIVGTLVGRVYVSTAEHLRRRPPSNMVAYDLTMRANWLAWDQPSTRAEARLLFEKAIVIDPGYGLSHSLLGNMLGDDWYFGLSGSPKVLDRAFALAKRGVELSDNESTCHMALGLLQLQRRCFDAALRHMERAVDLNPANPGDNANLGILLCRIDRAEEGLARLRGARRMDPYFGPRWYWSNLGVAQFVLRRYEAALADFEQGAPTDAETCVVMAGCFAKLGHVKRAQELVAHSRAIQPETTITNLLTRTAFKKEADREHLSECLRLAGLPE